MIRRTSWLVAIAALVVACGAGGPERIRLRLERGERSLEIHAEVAADGPARARGLMGRTRLASGEGMLFLFPGEPRTRSFWMKNTLVPLDIAFIRSGAVVDVQSMVPCRADPCPYTVSSGAADSALEVASGTFRRAGIERGASVVFFGDLPEPSP